MALAEAWKTRRRRARKAGSTSCWRASSRRGGSSCGVGVSKTTGILDVTSHLKAPESEPTSTSGNRSARLVAHMPILDLDSHRLHYLDEGRGLPVLLFHAYPLSAELFRPQIEALKDRFRFLVPDMRGFGQSGPADGPTTMRRMAQDGLALLDALGIERAVVGGVSMGGYVSMALLREDASRVLGLVLSSTQARADTEEARQGREA